MSRRFKFDAVGAGFAVVLCFANTAHAEPRRIVSLDYCADQFVLALADRNQIAALSRGAMRDDSYYRARAAGLPRTRATLEESLSFRPDLMVRNWGGPAEAAYSRFDIPLLQVGDAPDFAAARAQLLNAAHAIGQAERGRAIARDLDARLARLAEAAVGRRTAVMYLSAGGAVAGRGTMLDAVIDAAGGRNIRANASWTLLPLERMVATPPVVIALGFFDHGRERMNAWSRTRHPALRRALADARTINLPTASIACEAWFAIDAAEALGRELSAP